MNNNTNTHTRDLISPNENGIVPLYEIEYLKLEEAAVYSNYLNIISFKEDRKDRLYQKAIESRGPIYFFIALVSILATMLYFNVVELVFHLVDNRPFEDFWDYATIFIPVILVVAVILGVVVLIKLLKDFKREMDNIDNLIYEINDLYESLKTDPKLIEINKRIDELKKK